MTPIQAKVHVSKKPFNSEGLGETTRLAIRSKEIKIHVSGLATSIEPNYGPSSLLDGEMPVDVNRILQFASRFCRDKEDDEIWFVFEASNRIPI